MGFDDLLACRLVKYRIFKGGHRMKLYALFAIFLIGCGSPPAPAPIDPSTGPENSNQAPRPNKERLGNASYCNNWREAIADEISSSAPWGLPQTGVVSENIRGYFATQRPIDGVDYYPCVLADIFNEIPLHVEVLREAYFSLAPEIQPRRSDLALFLTSLYEEPLVIPLLVEIAVQPIASFSPEYIDALESPSVMEEESLVRTSAVLAISGSAPYEGDRQVWLDALFEVVAGCEVGGVPLIATWELKRMGITRAEFEQRIQPRLSDEDFTRLMKDGWQ